MNESEHYRLTRDNMILRSPAVHDRQFKKLPRTLQQFENLMSDNGAT